MAPGACGLLPGRECAALSSGARPALSTGGIQGKTWVWATSPFPCPEQNSGLVAQAGGFWHLPRLEHWLHTFGILSKPGFQSAVPRLGAGKAKPCFLRCPTQPWRARTRLPQSASRLPG